MKTVCKKLSPLKREVFLRFAGTAGAGRRRRRAQQDQAVHAVRVPSTGAADADTLHAVTIRSRTLAAAAISKGSASLMTELMTARLALIEVLDGYRQSSTLWLFDKSEQPPLYYTASVLRTHYSVKENSQFCAGTER